jgi:4-oxalocrotonate tautomerase
MPHVVVKLFPGRSEPQKSALAARIAQALVETADSREDAISVAIEEVAPADWMSQVYGPEIAPKLDTLYKKPGYGPK